MLVNLIDSITVEAWPPASYNFSQFTLHSVIIIIKNIYNFFYQIKQRLILQLGQSKDRGNLNSNQWLTLDYPPINLQF
jgi:hypothetical protein